MLFSYNFYEVKKLSEAKILGFSISLNAILYKETEKNEVCMKLALGMKSNPEVLPLVSKCI